MIPAARFALIEFKEGKLPEGPHESMKIPRAKLDALLTFAGLVFDHEQRDLLPYQVLSEAVKRFWFCRYGAEPPEPRERVCVPSRQKKNDQRWCTPNGGDVLRNDD